MNANSVQTSKDYNKSLNAKVAQLVERQPSTL